MQLEHSFTVAAPVDQAWAVLLDVERIAPCMPGATLTSFDDERFEGNVKVKLGPVSMTYAGRGRFLERDEANHRMVMEASGRDARGGGTAKATVTGTLTPAPSGAGTTVTVVTDLAVTGRPAQFGRGMIADVSGRLIGQFANCLASKLGDLPAAPAPATAPAPAQSVSPPAVPTQPTGAPAAPAPAPDTAALTEPATGVATEPADAEPAVAPPARAVVAPSAAPVEPIDLLQVTGVSGVARRVTPYLIGFVLGGLVAWGLLTWLA